MPGSASTEILVTREFDEGTIPIPTRIRRLELLASSDTQRRETLTSNYTYRDSEEIGQTRKDRIVSFVDHGGTISTVLFPLERLDDLLANCLRSDPYGDEWPIVVQPIREIWDGYSTERLVVQKQVEDSSEDLVYQVYRDCVVNGIVFNLGTDLEPRTSVSVAAERVEIRTEMQGPILPFRSEDNSGVLVDSINIDQANSSNKFHNIQIDRIILTFANGFSYRRGIGSNADPSGIRRGRVVVRGYLQGRFDSEISLEEARNREEGRIGFIVKSSSGSQYQFYLPRIRIDNSSVISAAATNPVIARIDFFALESVQVDESIIRIRRRST